jgi:uncharacterized DUF497 family protein
MIIYEWDEKKRLYNLKQHGLDFRRASLVYEDPNKITLASPYPDEERLVDMAEVEGRVLLLVYTIRDEKVRCISFRYAKRKTEGRIYYEKQKNG